MKRIKLLLALLMILPFTIISNAQDVKKEKMSIEKRTQNQVDQLAKKLELSKEQTDQVYDLKLSAAKERKADLEKLKEKIKAKDDEHKLKMKSILTEQQFEQYLEIRGAERMKRKMKRKNKRKNHR
jgi:hypothetical protein